MDPSTAKANGKTDTKTAPLGAAESFARILKSHPGFPEPADAPESFIERALAAQLTDEDRAWVGSSNGKRWLNADLNYFILTGKQPPPPVKPRGGVHRRC